MRNFLSKIIIIFLGLGFASCAKRANEPVKIRVVNLEGKPAPVNIKTMDLNVEALQQQGRERSKYVVTKPQPVVDNSQNDKFSYGNNNASSNMNLGAPQPENNFTQIVEEKSERENISAMKAEDGKKEGVLVYTLKGNASDNKDKANNLFADSSEEVIEIDLSENEENITPKAPVKSVKKSTAKKSVAKTVKSQKEYFVQVGSFGDENNAKNSLANMKKFHAGTIKQETVNGMITNRVLLGPFTNKSNARKLISDVKSSGHDAILIKEVN